MKQRNDFIFPGAYLDREVPIRLPRGSTLNEELVMDRNKKSPDRESTKQSERDIRQQGETEPEVGQDAELEPQVEQGMPPDRDLQENDQSRRPGTDKNQR
jgi:hypothetical protein